MVPGKKLTNLRQQAPRLARALDRQDVKHYQNL